LYRQYWRQGLCWTLAPSCPLLLLMLLMLLLLLVLPFSWPP
jgi:hypothetical protein